MDRVVVKRILMVAYQFPPMVGSSGMQRTLNFANYLVDHGWRPTVLTVPPIAHQKVRDEQLGEISDDVEIMRPWAVDAARHLSIRGRYLGAFARPDRWANWMLTAVPAGLFRLRTRQYRAVWSTYPIATSHCIGNALQRLSGLPWVADFRDMMIDETFPSDARMRESFRRIESRTVRNSAKVVVTTSGTKELYINRYPEQDPDKFVCIPNGYDEAGFAALESGSGYQRRDELLFVHSGSLHPSERDPTHFFEALAALKSEGFFDSTPVRVSLRATGFEEDHRATLDRLGIADIVSLDPIIAYQDALREMTQADGLLLFQAANCNRQVPAKLYEYLRARRPVLGITDPAGDTAQTLRGAGLSDVVRIDDTHDIKAGFRKIVDRIIEGTADTATADFLARHTRQSQAAAFAELLAAYA